MAGCVECNLYAGQLHPQPSRKPQRDVTIPASRAGLCALTVETVKNTSPLPIPPGIKQREADTSYTDGMVVDVLPATEYGVLYAR